MLILFLTWPDKNMLPSARKGAYYPEYQSIFPFVFHKEGQLSFGSNIQSLPNDKENSTFNLRILYKNAICWGHNPKSYPYFCTCFIIRLNKLWQNGIVIRIHLRYLHYPRHNFACILSGGDQHGAYTRNLAALSKSSDHRQLALFVT